MWGGGGGGGVGGGGLTGAITIKIPADFAQPFVPMLLPRINPTRSTHKNGCNLEGIATHHSVKGPFSLLFVSESESVTDFSAEGALTHHWS